MSIDLKQKQELIKEYSTKEGDTGSPEVQCAVLTFRINNLTEHLKKNSKDYSSRRGLLMLVGKRRRLLDYLKIESEERYSSLIKRLGVRK